MVGFTSGLALHVLRRGPSSRGASSPSDTVFYFTVNFFLNGFNMLLIKAEIRVFRDVQVSLPSSLTKPCGLPGVSESTWKAWGFMFPIKHAGFTTIGESSVTCPPSSPSCNDCKKRNNKVWKGWHPNLCWQLPVVGMRESKGSSGVAVTCSLPLRLQELLAWWSSPFGKTLAFACVTVRVKGEK